MEIFTIIIVVVIVCIILSLCGYCCKRSTNGSVTGPPITVTTAHVTTTPVVRPPYPVSASHPMPQHVPQLMPQPMPQPGLGFGDYSGGYQTTPYPPVAGPTITPYPPAQAAPPPSYNEAVSQPPALVSSPPVATENYTKQAPYNPNY